MKKKKLTVGILIGVISLTIVLSGCNSNKAKETATGQSGNNSAKDLKKYQVEEQTDGKTKFNVVTNPQNGKMLSYSVDGGIALLEEKDGDYTYAFKDLNKNGTLDTWEDWRVDIDERAASLASELTKEQIAGLMLFSSHERSIEDGLTEDQKTYLSNDNLRNVLNAGSNDIEASVLWNNEMQAYVETLGEDGTPVIPVNFSTDPRSTASADDQYMVDGTEISLWPSNLGLAATFDTETVSDFAKISSVEYRSLGISTLLGPQIDLATEPRWLRVDGTFGEDTKLATELTQAFVDGAQSTYDEDGKDLGWGSDSLLTMIKHFPGDGSGEGGRESHTNAGKYAVYPGNNFEEIYKPFIDGGLNLNGETKEAASVMSSYSVGLNEDGESVIGEAIASAYNKDKIDILRTDNDYDGVICTDWGVTSTVAETNLYGMAWGAEDMSIEERHFEILLAGVDMFGGNNDKAPVLAAYDLWQSKHEAGELESSADERFKQSAKRLVKLMIETNLFENPYLNLENTQSVVASEDKIEAGYQAQLDSVVMLKNANDTIKAADVTKDYKEMVVYIPSSINYGFDSIFSEAETTTGSTMDIEIAKQYFKEVITDTEIKDEAGEVTGYEIPDLSNVDMAIVGMKSPQNGNNFSSAGLLEDGSYYPLSLQYRTYTADGENVRKQSISDDVSRSYYGADSKIGNEYDLDACLNTVAAIEKTGKDIPVIVAMKAQNPVIMSEFEKKVDAIVVGFSVSDKALFDIILGKQEPQGLLPLQFPANMDTVEEQQEDVAHDMECYKDSEGNIYDFAYGLNYKGVISDERTNTYKISN